MSLSSLLHIQPGEEKKVYFALFQAFGTGAFQILLQIIPLALFLEDYPASLLPFTYIGMSILALILGFPHSYFEKRLSFYALFKLLLLTIVIPLLILNILAIVSVSKSIIFLLLVWAMLAWQLMELEFWGLFNRLFSLQQAKRLFGTIGATYNLGSIVASLVLPLLTPFISITKTFFIASVLPFVFLGVLWKLNQLFPSEMSGEETEGLITDTSQHQISFFSSIKTPYILQLFITTFLVSTLWYPIDFTFSIVIQEHYPTNQELTNFLSIFFATITSLELFCRLFLFKTIIHYFGVITSTSVLSLAITPVAFLALLFNLSDTQWSSAIFFGLVLLNKSLDNSFRPSIFEPTRLLMYQVLAPPMRAWVHSTTEISIKSASALFGSVAILAISYYFTHPLPLILAATFILAIASLIVNSSIKKQYIISLVESLKMGYFASADKIPWGKESLELIEEGIKSRHPGRTSYSLEVLEGIYPNRYVGNLSATLQHQAPAHTMNEDLEKLSRHALSNSPKTPQTVQVNSAALTAILALTNPDHSHVTVELNSKTLRLRSEAILELLKSQNDTEIDLATKEFYRLVHSSSPKKREEAAHILGEVPQFENSDLLDALLEDPSDEVKRTAIVSIAKLPHTKYYSSLLKLLLHPRLKDTVAHSCLVIGSDILPLLLEEFRVSSQHGKIHILYLISQMEIPTAEEGPLQATLLSWTRSEDDVVSYVLWETLSKLGFHLRKKDFLSLQLLEMDIAKESARLAYLLRLCQKLPHEKAFTFLHSSLRRQLLSTEQRLYLILSCYYPPYIIKKVMRGSKSSSIQQQEYAMELLQTLLTQKHSTLMLSSISAIHKKRSNNNGVIAKPKIVALLTEIALDEKSYLSPTCRAAALYALFHQQGSCPERVLSVLQAEKIPLIDETCGWIQEQQ